MYTAMASWMLQFALAGLILLALRLVIPMIWKEHTVRRLTTDEYLSKMARICDCSVYDLFHIAAGQWRVSRHTVERDFKNYITENMIPFYVNDLVRRHKTSLDKAQDIPLFINFH